MNTTPDKHGRHLFMMILCCLALLILGFGLQKLGLPGGFLIFLLCPIMHIFMMKDMMSKRPRKKD